MPAAGLHARHCTGRDRGGGLGRLGITAAVEAFDDYTRQTGIRSIRKGENDGEMGHG